MKNKISVNQMNDLWRNARLTVTTIVIPAVGFTLGAYTVCKPFREWADDKLEKIFHKKKKEVKE